MDNPAPTPPAVHDLVRRRHSPRAFADRDVEPADLETLFQAARWAPSCFNEQPWSFVVASRRDRESFERIAGCLVESNRRWATSAPVLMVSVARTTFTKTGKPNRHAWHDVGLAMGQLSLQATALGLAVHQMAGFDRERARDRLDIPPGYDPVAAVAIGYPGDPASLPEDLRAREQAPRTRRETAAFVFHGRWNPSP